MIEKYSGNPVVRPADVKPSTEGYKVHGVFNPGATVFGDEILLLLRVAEGCEPKNGYIRTPIYRFEEEQSYPDIMECTIDDPDVCLKDTRGVVYKGIDYLFTISHIRIERLNDGMNFTGDEKPFIFSVGETERADLRSYGQKGNT